ncbi:hypothetical protein GTO91_09435 [Heliobacterium undosum]|uniref:PilZ domain-containing protein n=1 Tax=Heliomicrobium undosum TaxID=121734 RepID=A0A845L505_9FIRM|nr:PilZ domain-containing protein [Heliomicrobium undosum]MZP29924.1 hypothetical protein [Heliomicrobium undosum]
MGEERRKHQRLSLQDKPLCATVRLAVENRAGQIRQSDAIDLCVVNISPGGAQLLSHLRFPTATEYPGLTMHLRTRLSGLLKENARIVWRREEGELFRYGVEFVSSNEEKENLLRVQIYNAESFLQKRDIANMTIHCNFCAKDECPIQTKQRADDSLTSTSDM